MRTSETKQNRRLYRLAVSLLVGLWAVTPGWVNALPSGGDIVSGKGSINIEKSSPQKMMIKQDTQRLITNWKGFSIGSAESVTFKQPNSSAIALNRVIGIDPSIILGKLSANGQVFLSNPSGVVFGQSAQVDVHGLLATTLNISNEDFLKGNYKFSQGDTRSLAAIINNGTINATRYVGLAAPAVENNGSIIVADLGSVALASGTAATLDFYGDGLISFAVTGKVSGDVTDVEGKKLKDRILNSGHIRADGGQVLLTARSAGKLIGNVINHSGIIEARTIQKKDGKIVLSGSEPGAAQLSETEDVATEIYPEQPVKGKIIFSGGGEGTVGLSGTLDASRIYVVADAVAVAASKSLLTNNGDIKIFANDLDLKGDLNSGTGDVVFTLANRGDLNLDPGNPNGGLGGNDIGHIIAKNLILNAYGDINVKGISEKNTAGISDAVILNSLNDITFEDVASTFPALKLYAGDDVNVNANVTTLKGDVNIAANDLNLTHDLNSGSSDVIFTRWNGRVLNLAPGDPGEGLGGNDLSHIFAKNLVLKTNGDINVKGITEQDTAGVTDSVILESGGDINFEEMASTFGALKLFAITDINVNVDITTTKGDFIAEADSEINGVGDFNLASDAVIKSARDIDVTAVNINADEPSFDETRDLILNDRLVGDEPLPPPLVSIATESIQQGSLSSFLTEFFQNGGSGGC